STAVFTNATSTNLSYSGGLSTPFTQGSVVFAGANGVLSENNSGLYFNATTNRLGIGTTTPGYDVEVSGSMRLWESASTTTLVVRAGALQNLSTTPYVFEVLDASGGRLGGIRIDGYSAAKIFSTADSVTAAISQAGIGYSPGFNLNTSSGIAWASAGQWYAAKDTSISRIAAGKVGIGTGAIGNYSGALLVGSIGINTSTPGYSLTIAGVSSATASSIYISPSTDGTSERASLVLDNWEVGQDYSANGTKNFYIKDTASSTARFFIDKQGNVGVGTTTPQSAFHLASGNFTQTASNPSILGNYLDIFTASGYSSIAVSGDYAYFTNEFVSGASGGLYIVNISDKNSPVLVSKTTAVNFYNSTDIEIKDNYAYVLAYNYLSIVDISNPSSPQVISSFNDPINLAGASSFYLSGNYVYVANKDDNSLKIIDVSSIYDLKIIGSLQDNSNLAGARSVYVDGNFAYVAAETADGISVIDVEDVSSPILMGFVSSTSLNGVRNIDVSGNHLYAVNGVDSSLTIVDISSSTDPNIVGTIKDNTNLLGARSVYVSGNYAYVGIQNDNSFRIIDISDVTTPFIFSGVKDDTYLLSIWDFSIVGKYAYTINYSGGLTILDIAGIDAPTANIGNIQSNNINVTDNFNVGNDAYLNGGLVVGGHALFGGSLSFSGLKNATADSIYISPSSDVTSERAALSLDNWNIGQDYNADGTKNFYIKDTASSTARFFIDKQGNVGVGTTTPQSTFHLASGSFTQTVGSDPTIIGSVVSSTALNGTSVVYVAGNYAYVGSQDNDSFSIIDISNVNNPTIVSTIVDGTNLSFPTSVFVSGEYAYVTNGLSNALHVIDVSVPTSPSIVGTVTGSSLTGARFVYVSGNYAYVSSYSNNYFNVVDISNPTKPFVKGSLFSSGNFSGMSGIYVKGNYAYVVNNLDDSVRILDVSDPSIPTLVAGLKDATNLNGAYSIYVSGGYAYVANNVDDSVRILDVSDPTATPTIVAGLKDATNLNGANSIYVSGKYAYVANTAADSMVILDIAGIRAPTASIGSIETNNLNVTNNLSANNDAYIGNGLSVIGDGLFGGALSIAGGLTLTDATSTTSTVITLDFDSNGTTQWAIKLDKSDNSIYFRDNDGNDGVVL
ncbi:MAG: hypothetical protein A2485_15915, partial [Bdellovibrionales bacterium RIFOXYC12_FULL_39_17]